MSPPINLRDQIMDELTERARTDFELAIELGSNVVEIWEAIAQLQREKLVSTGELVDRPACARKQIEYRMLRTQRAAALRELRESRHYTHRVAMAANEERA